MADKDESGRKNQRGEKRQGLPQHPVRSRALQMRMNECLAARDRLQKEINELKEIKTLVMKARDHLEGEGRIMNDMVKAATAAVEQTTKPRNDEEDVAVVVKAIARERERAAANSKNETSFKSPSAPLDEKLDDDDDDKKPDSSPTTTSEKP